MAAAHLFIQIFVDPFPFTLRLLKGRISLPGMFRSRCRFRFSRLERIVKLAECSFCICYRTIRLSEFLAKGVPDLGRSA